MQRAAPLVAVRAPGEPERASRGAPVAWPLALAVNGGPRMSAQRQAIQLWSQASRGMDRHVPPGGAALRPLRSVAQLEDYPEDSTGTIDKVMASLTKDDKKTDITGTQIQKHILKWARSAGEEPGGYRLGSYYFTSKGQFVLKTDTSDDEAHGMEYLPDTFERQNMDVWIVALIKGTLRDAGQLQYIAKNAGSIFPTHHVVIDVDCQFDRTGNVGFHKDSRGTTAFVNLSFDNEDPMEGTEHYEDLEGDPGLVEQLPEEVQKDVARRREGFTGDRGVRSRQLPKYGRISFSDPSLYHSTPLMGHRGKLTGDETRSELIDYLADTKDRKHLERMPIEMLRKLATYYLNPFNMHGFEEASKVKGERYDKTLSTAHKSRRLSVDLSEGRISQEYLDQEALKKRTFIRTWVRFVPK